jgi:uncharacterized protein YabN with tetrapyrrole methylase and pyrophosphatase domain
MESNNLNNGTNLDPYDIYIVGTGIIPALHLTRESEAAIRRSKEVLYIDKSFGSEEFLKSLCPNITDLHAASYRESEERLDAYRKMASLVINAALDHPPVTFALYGHPLVYALPPFIVLAMAKLIGLRVKVMPGISSLDTLFVDLKFDPCTYGIQMYEATDLLLRKRPIQPDVPCFIWQIGTVESRLYTESSSKPERFRHIKEYLMQFYPPNTPMVAVYSSSMPLTPSILTEFTLETIEEKADELHQGLTVYIPPVIIREVQDQDLLKAMDDSTYLKEVTQNI